MAIQKQNVSINFNQGLDTKTDPFQLPSGKFESLENMVFDKTGRLTKRNGFGSLGSLPDNTSRALTTFNGNLTAIGTNLKAFAQGPGIWVTKGGIEPLQLSTLPLIRNTENQSQADTAISANGLVCTVYTESVNQGSTTSSIYKYAIADSTTGQNVLSPTLITSSFGGISQAPRVFTLGTNFIVVLTASSASVSHLQYLPISSVTNSVIGSVTDLTTSYSPSSTGSFDGVVANNNLYLSWNGASNSGLKSLFLTRTLTISNTITIATSSATIVSVTADNTGATPVIWSSGYSLGSSNGFTVATSLTSGSGSSQSLATLFSSKRFVSSSVSAVTNLASSAKNGVLNLYYEVTNTYNYGTGAPTNFINTLTSTQTGSLSATTTLVRSVGLASKAFLVNSTSYFLASYSSPYQPTYFLMNQSGGVVAKLAYSNAGGYVTSGLTSATVTGSTVQFAYLFKDLIQAVNKDTNVSAGTQVNGIYSQTGINLATVTFGTQGLVTSETAGDLHINGGFLWMYDGYTPVEHNFHLWPDNVNCSVSSSAGNMTQQTYYYQSTYEWTDNQGNAFRSSPSIPSSITLGSGGSQVIVSVPTLRLTYKLANPVKVVIYRWSQAQQTYYQCTSITTPTLNSTSFDSVVFTDNNSDATILGNNILYTNGGVVENIGAPATGAMTQFDSRLWLIDSEDPNLLWFSKQVIESVPVEMSDLFTLFVPPAVGAQGNTGPIKSISPMDDKLIIFKKNAIYYIAGTGPDNTGANNQYSSASLVTGTVGCSNQNSIVLIPNGLMFQSDKGIWLLARDLSTNYIGKDVEAFNADLVVSALTIPGTNQVRFTLTSGVTLMYDYFQNQWGEFTGIPGVSSTLYNNKHTFINSLGKAFQETPGLYLDGSNPTLMSFVTGWQNLAGLQGYQRAYKMYLLGSYTSPHKLSIGVAYDYDSSVVQLSNILPDNYSAPWGSDPEWGSGTPWGGSTKREQWQINFERQQCQAFQISFNEYFDSSLGASPGAGLSVSGINLVAGLKKGFPGNIPKTHKV